MRTFGRKAPLYKASFALYLIASCTGGQRTPPAYDATPPTITNVEAVTTNGNYGVGSTIRIKVKLNEAVSVERGPPTLELETGATNRLATYAGQSDPTVLLFDYTVQSGDETSDLEYASRTALTLNDGTIKDANGNDLILYLPKLGQTGSLAFNSAIFVDGVAPTWGSAFSLSLDEKICVGSATDCTTNTPALNYTQDATDNSAIVYEYSIIDSSNNVEVNWTNAPAVNTAIDLSALAPPDSLAVGDTYTLRLRARDALNNATTKTDTWLVESQPVLTFATSTLTGTRRASPALSYVPNSLALGTQSTFTSCAATGGTLPTGLTLNTSGCDDDPIDANLCCSITGTPTTVLNQTTFTITLTNSFGRTAATTVDLTVNEDWSDDDNSATVGFAAASSGTGISYNSSSSYMTLANANGCDATSTNCSEHDETWSPSVANMVAYWKLNSLSGGNFSATIGSDLVSSFGAGGGSVGAAKLNNGVTLDGTDDYLSVSDSAALSPTTSLTVAFWMKQSSLGASKTIISKWNGANNEDSWSLQTDSIITSKLKLLIGQSTTAETIYAQTPTNSLAANLWQHIVFVYDGSGVGDAGKIQIYINGVKQALSFTGTIPSTIIDSTASLRVGAYKSTPSQFFAGSIDEISIWNSALTEANVQNIFGRQSATMSGFFISRAFEFNQNTNTWNGFKWLSTLPFGKELPSTSETSTDYSSLSTNTLLNGITGIWHLNGTIGDVSNGATISAETGSSGTLSNGGSGTSYVPGTFLEGLSFDGTDDYVSIPNPSLGSTTQLTISFWMRPRTLLNGTPLITKWNDEANMTETKTSWALRLGNSGKLQFLFGTDEETGDATESNYWVTSNSVFDVGKWTHVVAQWDTSIGGAGYQGIYINGESVSVGLAGSLGTNLTDSNTDIRIGSTQDASSLLAYSGEMDEIAIWSRALSADEILQLYRRGVNRLKFQVRTCTDSTCSDRSSSGDWLGPDGTNLSYFSELQNNSTLNASTGRPTGSVLTGFSDLSFNLFSNLTVATRKFFQYRSILESDDQTAACASNSTCFPELKSVTVTP